MVALKWSSGPALGLIPVVKRPDGYDDHSLLRSAHAAGSPLQRASARERSQSRVHLMDRAAGAHVHPVVGEDLGTVEPFVREALARFGILSYRLFYFERDASGRFLPASAYPVQALVSSTTHDLPTLAGFWKNEDIEARWRAGVLGGEENYRAQLAARGSRQYRPLSHRP